MRRYTVAEFLDINHIACNYYNNYIQYGGRLHSSKEGGGAIGDIYGSSGTACPGERAEGKKGGIFSVPRDVQICDSMLYSITFTMEIERTQCDISMQYINLTYNASIRRIGLWLMI